LKNSLRLKVMLAILVTTAVALIVATVTMLVLNLRDFRGIAVRDIQTQLELIGRATAPALQFGDAAVAAENLSLLDIRPRFEAAALYDASGQLFASYVRTGYEGGFSSTPGSEGVSIERDTVSAFERIIVDGEVLGTIYARANYRLHQRFIEGIGVILLIIFLALMVAIFVSNWFQSFLIRPVLEISRVSREVISKRDYSLRAVKMSDDEVGTLADSFNAMLAEIEQRDAEQEKSNREMQKEVAERRRVENEIMLLNRELDLRVKKRTKQLEQTNAELESFAYSVSHDLRAPLRSIDGYSEALIDEVGEDLSTEAARYLDKIRGSTRRMGQLIEDLLNLSRLSRADLKPVQLDLSTIAHQVIEELRQRAPDRNVDVTIRAGMQACGDPRLVRLMLENLLENAWKFTSTVEHPALEVGVMHDHVQAPGRAVYFVRDNGVGFDMAYSQNLFGVFHRLHAHSEFPGTGIGLATVQRIVQRHGGRIWANAAPGEGAVFFFTLSSDGGLVNS
jgi:signal transduction histidine kinase